MEFQRKENFLSSEILATDRYLLYKGFLTHGESIVAKAKATKIVNKKKPVKPMVLKSKTKKAASKPLKSAETKTLKLGVPKAPYKKSELFGVLAEQTNLAKKEIQKVIEILQTVIKLHLVKNGPGQFTLPGICKMTTMTKPATKARKGKNPFNGEEMMFKAKPARRVVKARVLKKLKAEVE